MPEQPIAFGPFLLNPDNGTLFRDGVLVAIGQRGALLLGALAKSPGQVRTKAELMDAAWPGMAVEDSNLSVQISSLRKLLGLSPDGGEWIVTIPRVGYRFVGEPVSTTPVRTQTTPSESVIPSLAVLPFQNLGGDVEQDYFADGVVADIITALSRFKSFAVIARNSSFVYKGRAVDVRQVARELGVRYVLEGSVRRAGHRLRITAQLVEGTSGAHLWARNFDGALEDIFDVQDRITEGVVAVVEPQIQKAEIDHSRRKRPDSLDAYDLYLRALSTLFSISPEANAAALELLDRAIAIDSAYANALALAGMGLEHRMSMGWPAVGDDDAHRSLAFARAALTIAPDDATVLARSGIVLQVVGQDYDGGLRILKRAVEANPNDCLALTLAGVGQLKGGSLEEAPALFYRVIQLSPGEPVTAMTGIAHALMCLGRYEEALDWAERSLAVKPNYNPTHWMLIAGNAHLGRLGKAKRALAALQGLVPGVSLSRLRSGQHAKDPSRFDVVIEGMRLAGMPEV